MTISITVHSAREVSVHDEPGPIARLIGRRRRDYAAFLAVDDWFGPDNRSLPDRLQDRIDRAVTRWFAQNRIDGLKRQ